MKARWLLRIGRVIAIVFVIAAVLGFVVMQLWNGLIPELFHGPVLGYWQAVGLLLLSRLLLMGGPRGGPGGWRRNRWRRQWQGRMANMSPEERERYRQEWGRECGWRPGGMESEEKMGASGAGA
jgi:hypothetical protein